MKAKDLKNSILQMAVQGKLVPQDPDDEPASALLERIRAERARLIKDKKLKAPKGGESVIYLGSDGSRYEKRVDAKGRESEPICIDGEVPFEIPKGWEWARLCDIADFAGGKTPSTNDKSNYADNGILWVTSKDMKRDFIDSTLITLSEKGASELTLYEAGTILMVTRSGILRRMLPVAMLKKPATVNQDQKAICPFDKSLSLWILTFLKASDLFIRQNYSKAGTTVESIVFDKVKTMLVPIPPLAEQRRIAERVSELMPLVEEYGKLEDEREALDAALPGHLRKSVLQMAVEGKLLPQDPGDEPASVLLDRIRAERARLIKDKKLKAPKGGESVIYLGSDGRRYEKRVDAKGRESEPICIDGEVPFEIPKGWEWARLESVLFNRDAERIPVSVAEREKLEKRYDYYGASGVIDKVDKYLFDKPLLLIGEDGANLLTRTKPIAFMARGQYWVNNHAHVLDGISEAFLEYIALFMNSISLAPYVTGTAQPKMNQAKMNSILIPLPPKEEQARILKQVSRLSTFITNR